jgi:hypothetical protein
MLHEVPANKNQLTVDVNKKCVKHNALDDSWTNSNFILTRKTYIEEALIEKS